MPSFRRSCVECPGGFAGFAPATWLTNIVYSSFCECFPHLTSSGSASVERSHEFNDAPDSCLICSISSASSTGTGQLSINVNCMADLSLLRDDGARDGIAEDSRLLWQQHGLRRGSDGRPDVRRGRLAVDVLDRDRLEYHLDHFELGSRAARGRPREVELRVHGCHGRVLQRDPVVQRELPRGVGAIELEDAGRQHLVRRQRREQLRRRRVPLLRQSDRLPLAPTARLPGRCVARRRGEGIETENRDPARARRRLRVRRFELALLRTRDLDERLHGHAQPPTVARKTRPQELVPTKRPYRSDCTKPRSTATSRRARSTSATDHAWNGQPLAACGGAPSAVSEIEPSPHSARCSSIPSSACETSTPARSPPSTFRPSSHGHTVPWW